MWGSDWPVLTLAADYGRWIEVTDALLAELSPGSPIMTAPGVAQIARRGDGHYAVRMKANGTELMFLFDTGATMVVVRGEDARRIGIDPAKLNFAEEVSTANGVTQAAPITLDSLAVGTIVQRHVRALVARPQSLNENLLGQSFLEGLAGYGVENGRLILRGK